MLVIGCLLVGSVSWAAEPYTIGMLPDVGWSYNEVAEVKGFWEKQGVSVKLVHYDIPLELMRVVLQRRVDFIPGPLAGSLSLREGGVSDVMYVGTFSMAGDHKYLLLKKDLVKKSLKGQTIGVFNSDFSVRFLLSSYLHTVNTTLADVRLVEMNPDVLETNFTNNRVQAALCINLGNRFSEKTDGVIAISTEEFYEPHGLAIVKQGGVAAIPPDDLKKILRGVVEAIMWIQDPGNWDEYKAILKELTGNPDLSDDQMHEFMNMEKFFDPQTMLEHNQQQLTDYFAQFRAFLTGEGAMKADVLKDYTYENVINNQALIEVLQEFVK